MPELSARSEGTRTLSLPAAPTCRKGSSRTTGVSAALVYGGSGHSPAGGFTTPTKTIFQFDPVHDFHSLFREIHCCCEPESTFPSVSESDIHPPLAQPRCWCSTISPRTCIRRNDTACDTAHCIGPPTGVTETPEIPRQRVVVALLFPTLASA